MPLELGVWRIDSGLEPIPATALDLESRLEDILAEDLSIADPGLMLIGRQVRTVTGKYVDLLAMNRNGDLVVLELKRDKTPREIVAQVLDYGHWVRELRDDDIARIFHEYGAGKDASSLDDAFCSRFHAKSMPDELNSEHHLLIVASGLDDETERIVEYLATEGDIHINAAFFRVFRDGDREYLTRAWLRDPSQLEVTEPEGGDLRDWNGEYYVSFGDDGDRDWDEARKYGFVGAGGGSWYTGTLRKLEPGNRIWVNIPGVGYVGVGEVTASAVPIDEFQVDVDEIKKRLLDLPVNAAALGTLSDDPETAEYIAAVKWIHSVPKSEAVREKGFFGNQNTVAKPRAARWEHTVQRLRKRWQLAL